MKKKAISILTAFLTAISCTATMLPTITGTAIAASTSNVKFDEDEFYVAVGTCKGATQLRYFAQKSDGSYTVEKVVWEDAPADISYGDVFIGDGNIEMTKVMAAPDNPVYAMAYYYQLDDGEKLNKVGKCDDFMEKKVLTASSKTYDGSAHWSIRYKDSGGKEYYYGLSNFASTLTVDPLDCEVGDVYTYALCNDYMVIPLAKENDISDVYAEPEYKIVKLPDKVEYKLGEQIDLKGIEIEVTKDKKEPVVYTYPDVAFDYQSNIPKSPSVVLSTDFRNDKAGTYKVEVVGADNVSFDVKVVDYSAISDTTETTTTTSTTTTETSTTFSTTTRSTGTMPVSTDAQGRILDQNGNVLIVNGTSAVVSQPVTTTTTAAVTMVFNGTKKMTLDDVWDISLRNGVELSWSDFKEFEGERLPYDGSEQQYKFGIDDTYSLLLTGNPPERPINIFLVYKDQNGVNVRVDDIVAFLLETATVKVTATVIAINENTVILKPIDGSEELKSSDRFNLPSRYLGDIKPTQGMKLEITYIGGILETDPPQFVYVHNVTVVSDVPEILKGDANCDDQVDFSDAVMIMQALANPNKYGIDGTAEHHLTEQGKLNGDMNGDGLTVGDAQAIQRKLLGLDKANSAVLFGIDKAKVTGVNVSSLPEGYDYTFTDKNAQAIVDYLSNISLSTNLSVEDPGQLNGMTWVIKLNYENGDTVTLYDLGKFIHGEDCKWYEMTYEESQELSNLIWKLGKTDNDISIDNSAIAGKIFAYEKEGAGGYCTLSFNENGRFLYSPGKLSSYMSGGDWKIDGDTVSLIGMADKTIYLKITDDTLVYIAEGSDEFPYMDIKDGEKFGIYRPEISSDKFQLNSRYSEYGLGNPKVELNLIASELPEFCYVENVRLYDEDDNFIGMMSPAMDADIWGYLVDCNITEECSKTYYTLTKIRCGQKTYLDDVRSEITVNFKVTPAP